MSQKVASLYAEIGADTKGLESGLTKTKGMLGSTRSAFSALGLSSVSTFLTVSGAVATGVTALKIMVGAAAESEAVSVRLAAALKATGREGEVSAAQLQNTAVALEHVSAFDDESINSAYAALAQFENVPTDKMQSIARAAMDMTAALGGDLAGNAELIGRVLETGVIPRAWGFSIALRQNIQDEIKAGDTGKALADVLGALNSRFGGQAAAQLKTYNGMLQKTKNDWGDLLEALGQAPMGGGKSVLGFMDSVVLNLGLAQQAYNNLREDQANAWDNIPLINYLKYLPQIRSEMQRIHEAQYGYRGRGALPPPMPEVDSGPLVDYSAKLSQLQMIVGGDLGKTYDDFSKRVRELNIELAKTTNKEDKAALKGQIDELTKAYEKDTAAIIYNSQAQLINNAAGMEDKDKAQILTTLAQAYGLMDQKTADLVNSSAALIDQWHSGKLTSDQLARSLEMQGFHTENEMEAAEQLNVVLQKQTGYWQQVKTEHGGVIRVHKEWIDTTNKSIVSVQNLAGNINGQLVPAQANLRDMTHEADYMLNHAYTLLQLLNGMSSTAYFHLVTTGGMPSLPSSGVGSGRMPTPPGFFPTIPWMAEGGPGSGWTVVGERGAELVKLPTGSYVHSHQDSLKILSDAATKALAKLPTEHTITLRIVDANGHEAPLELLENLFEQMQ